MDDKKVSLSAAIEQIEKMYSIFNEHFYNNELIHPVITVIPKGRRNCLGWCSSVYHWQDKEKETGYHEINICAEYLSLAFPEMAEILLHEMAHLYNTQHGISDTCRSGTYHNKKYYDTATSHGLIVEKIPSHGWAKTALSHETEKFIQTLTAFNFDFARIEFNKKSKKKQSSIKLVCPICGCCARVTSPKVEILCKACNTSMV